ncbi:MAG: hypothetical protein VZQ98_09725 [Bacteroidales bacterium]|nr:hypothetical protein [Bacteroidales bacterium]
MSRYSTLLSSIKKLFNVNDGLREELNDIAIEQHNRTLDELLDLWARNNSMLNNSYNELIEYLNELNNEPYSITDMQELYDFVYDFE